MTKKITILLSLLVFLTLSANAQNRLKGTWLLVSMTDEKGTAMALPEKKEITLNFADSKVWARVCNSIIGKYSVKNQKIKIDFTISTMMACREMETEAAFKRLVVLADTYSVKNNELILSGKKNKPTLKFTKMTAEKPVRLNGKWQLVSMILERDMAIPLPEKMITLNIDNNKIGGNGGCNSYGGSFLQSGKTVRFSEIFSTKMWCEGSSPTEQQYFNALEKSVNYEIKNGQLILTDAKRENTLVFKQS